MNKNEVEVKFPMTQDIWDLVVATATSEENPWVKEENPRFFVVVYHDSECYSAMATRLSGLLKPLINAALGTLFSSEFWEKVVVQARLEHEGDVTMPTPFGAIATYHVGNETRH